MNTALWIIAIVNTASLALAIWQVVTARRGVTNIVNTPPVTRETVQCGDLTRTMESWALDQKRPGGLL